MVPRPVAPVAPPPVERQQAVVTKQSASSESSQEYEEDDSSDEENVFIRLEERQSKSAPRMGENEIDVDEIKRANSARVNLKKHRKKEEDVLPEKPIKTSK